VNQNAKPIISRIYVPTKDNSAEQLFEFKRDKRQYRNAVQTPLDTFGIPEGFDNGAPDRGAGGGFARQKKRNIPKALQRIGRVSRKAYE
jgi:hypothetical protein